MSITSFTNCRVCYKGRIITDQTLHVSEETGKFLMSANGQFGDVIDLKNALVSPGFLELQMNGRWGFHFTNFQNPGQYQSELSRLAEKLLRTGVTGFFATIPTIQADLYPQILPFLRPWDVSGMASLLGAHVEGPYLHPSKCGAHNPNWLQISSQKSPSEIYGDINLSSAIKLVTIAPELEGSKELIKCLTQDYGLRVSLGHSTANYATGLDALRQGATALTHVFNAMMPLHHREPNLVGLISATEVLPYYSLIADNIHLHRSILSTAFRANPSRAILITDSLEVGGLPDGMYPENPQIPHLQCKIGDKVVIAGTDTLIGGCADLNECVKNLIQASGCSVAEAVRCVTENIADLMGLEDRGSIEVGKRADFVVLSEQGEVLQTWLAGKKVWP